MWWACRARLACGDGALPVVDGQSLGSSHSAGRVRGFFLCGLLRYSTGKRVLMDVRVRGWDTESMATARDHTTADCVWTLGVRGAAGGEGGLH